MKKKHSHLQTVLNFMYSFFLNTQAFLKHIYRNMLSATCFSWNAIVGHNHLHLKCNSIISSIITILIKKKVLLRMNERYAFNQFVLLQKPFLMSLARCLSTRIYRNLSDILIMLSLRVWNWSVCLCVFLLLFHFRSDWRNRRTSVSARVCVCRWTRKTIKGR